MAFEDSPKVDKNAERSEESLIECQRKFSRKNGFISHKIDGTDDYGVDLNVQLIVEGKASPYYFPIQVKSKISYTEISIGNEKYKTCSFKTSRLGYLIRHKPTTGLIVIYDETKEQLFYDFSYEIYNRIRLHHDDDKWLNQDSITIHIPESNLLKNDIVSDVHSRLLNLFENHDRLLNERGRYYDLPDVVVDNENRSPVEILERFGNLLFDSYKFKEIIALIDKLNKYQLKRPIISYLGAITYTEVGDIIEADYFFKLCSNNRNSYSVREQEIIRFQKFKFDYYSGGVSRKQLIQQLENMKETSTTIENQLYLKTNLLSLEALDLIGKKKLDEGIFTVIENYFDEVVDKVENIEQQHFLLIFLSDILSKFVGRFFSDILIDARIGEVTGFALGAKRTERLKRVLKLNEKSKQYVLNALAYAEKNENKLLEAHCHLNLALSFFGHCFSYFIAKHHFEKNEQRELLEEILKSSLKAYNIFIKLQLVPFAFNSITLAYEIYSLAESWAGVSLSEIVSISKIEAKIKELENADSNKGFVSQVKKADRELTAIHKKENGSIPLGDDEIDICVRIEMQNLCLPDDRYKNVRQSVAASSKFYHRNQNPDLLFTDDQRGRGKDAYIQSPKFAVVSKTTGILYARGNDVETIFKKLGI